MGGRKQTALGYLLDYLDIGLGEVSELLNIEKSSISKWRTGARPLRPDSPYFADIVRLIAEKLQRGHGQRLRELLEQNGLEADDDESVHESVRALLAMQSLPGGLADADLRQTRLYQTELSVYQGVRGKKDALRMLLDTAERQEKPAELHLIDAENFSWVARDEAFAGRTAAQLRRLLDAGHSVQLVRYRSQPDHMMRWLDDEATALYARDRFFLSYLDWPERIAVRPSLGVLDSRLAVVGHMFQDGLRYTASLSDPFSVAAAGSSFAEYQAGAVPALETVRGRQWDTGLWQELREQSAPDRLGYVAATLPAFTMEPQLLHEVAAEHDLTGRERNRLVQYWEQARAAALEAPALEIMLPAALLKSALRAEQTAYPELSFFAGRELRLTREQVRRHALATAALLRETGHCGLYLLPRRATGLWRELVLLFRRNGYLALLNAREGKVRYSRHPMLLEQAAREMISALGELTGEMRSAVYVAERLTAMAEGD